MMKQDPGDDSALQAIRKDRARWEAEQLATAKTRKKEFLNGSGYNHRALYDPSDAARRDYRAEVGLPGEYPYRRGVHATLYRSQPWTMRLFSGFATAVETNERYHKLLAGGQGGLSVAFDMPTLMGYDSDHPRSLGEVGKCGVAVDTLADMETLFRGIPLDAVSTSMTINGPAAVLLAMYLVVAEKNGVPWTEVRGTLQNDILKEYHAQKEFLFPPRPAMKIVVDTVEFCSANVPQWNSISISGYHIREAGATALQELAFTLYDGISYVRACIERGMEVDSFAPRLSFFFDSHNNFFEEICKFRAARVIWARVMKEWFGAKNPKSWKLRFHTQTAGVSLTAQQPENNIVRTAYQAMAAVLGGTQSLHTNAMDETWALPTEKSAEIALRTQQILAFETGVADVVDPLAGSYFVEDMTDWMIKECFGYFEKIESEGGIYKAIESGFFQRELARSAYDYAQQLESEEEIIVGVNRFQNPGEKLEIPILKIGRDAEQRQCATLAEVKADRDQTAVDKALARLREAASAEHNIMPALLDAVRVYATLGEMVEVMKAVYGEYREPAFI
jgi:methylmalonyl-CoA mutase N-terminal domain/subunit